MFNLITFKPFLFKTFLASLLMTSLLFLPCQSLAQNPGSAELQAESARTLMKLNIMQGDNAGNLRLNDKIKRSEFITLIIRTMGEEKEENMQGIDISFKDITAKHWAYNNVKIALKLKILSGYPDNTIAPDNYVTYAEALTVLTRVLGYEGSLQGKWPDNVISMSKELGITNSMELPQDKQITRGEVAVLIKNSLQINFGK